MLLWAWAVSVTYRAGHASHPKVHAAVEHHFTLFPLPQVAARAARAADAVCFGDVVSGGKSVCHTLWLDFTFIV